MNQPIATVTPPRQPRIDRPSGRQTAFAERTRGTLLRRRVVNYVMVGLTYTAALLATLPLLLILWHLVKQGATTVSMDFFTSMPKPVGEEGGGMANAIVGSLIIVGLASAMGLPIGVGACTSRRARERDWRRWCVSSRTCSTGSRLSLSESLRGSFSSGRSASSLRSRVRLHSPR
jgi:hypothetical protein